VDFERPPYWERVHHPFGRFRMSFDVLTSNTRRPRLRRRATNFSVNLRVMTTSDTRLQTTDAPSRDGLEMIAQRSWSPAKSICWRDAGRCICWPGFVVADWGMGSDIAPEGIRRLVQLRLGLKTDEKSGAKACSRECVGDLQWLLIQTYSTRRS
jgi:hypothetical protein